MNTTKVVAIRFYDIAKDMDYSDNDAIHFVDNAFAALGDSEIKRGYTKELRCDIISEMDQKYNKTWKAVTLRAAWIGTRVVLQIVGEYGYCIEEVFVNPMTSAGKRRKRFQSWLNEFNETYNSHFTLDDISCVDFNNN